ncbi:BRCT domain-containing protein [Secundilactobacillus kimchicus]|uniref:BRCT domain-containing protein n=1 Tax=Secundilactobacillus kimchicus TaxID=528209 RepID=UPI0024A9C899|nr:BRCT domain-containing protein [Secundilactobacillus kimchicus]
MLDLKQCEIVFTGKLNTLTRKQAFWLAKICGARPKAQPTKQTQYVIAGKVEKPFTESLTTRKLLIGVPIVREADFLQWTSQVLGKWSRNLRQCELLGHK